MSISISSSSISNVVCESPRRIVRRNKSHSQARRHTTGPSSPRPTLARSKSDNIPEHRSNATKKHLVDYSRTRATHDASGANRSQCRGPMMSRNVYHPSRKSSNSEVNWTLLSSTFDMSSKEESSIAHPAARETDYKEELKLTKSRGGTAPLPSTSIRIHNNVVVETDRGEPQTTGSDATKEGNASARRHPLRIKSMESPEPESLLVMYRRTGPNSRSAGE